MRATSHRRLREIKDCIASSTNWPQETVRCTWNNNIVPVHPLSLLRCMCGPFVDRARRVNARSLDRPERPRTPPHQEFKVLKTETPPNRSCEKSQKMRTSVKLRLVHGNGRWHPRTRGVERARGCADVRSPVTAKSDDVRCGCSEEEKRHRQHRSEAWRKR